MHTPTLAGGLLHAGSASTPPRTILPPQALPWNLGENTEKRDHGTTTRRKNLKRLPPSCRRKVIEIKSRQNLVFDPGGCSGRLCGYLFLAAWCALLRGRMRLGRRDGIGGWSVVCRIEDCNFILFQEGQAVRRTFKR